MLITSGRALAWALYDREHEGLPSSQTLIYKTCSFWNWVWPLPHLQWTSALHCMGFLISPRCSLICCVLFFCWDIKVCELAHSHPHTLRQPFASPYRHLYQKTHTSSVHRHESPFNKHDWHTHNMYMNRLNHIFRDRNSSAATSQLVQVNYITRLLHCS